LIFHWLKNVVRVDQVLRVVVEDLDGKSHSDTAILNSLKNLNVQTWNWKKLDISSDVIYQAAGSVTEVYLYCSGNNAVLRGWSDSQGLVLLKTLKTIHLEVNQGLESPQIVQNYIKQFRTALVKRFKEVYKRDIDIFSKIIEHIPQKLNEKLQAAKPKILGEEGYEEQQWLKCMDEFADFVTLVSAAEEEEKPVKVAIIDDGVKSAYDNLDANIAGGESWVSQPISEDPHSPYLTSVKGHGTVMAYFIRRICPEVKLYVLKLDPQMMGSRVTFSIESATEAIEWAVKNEMDIISMSWAIDPIPRKNGKEDLAVRRLRTAISKAVGKYAALLFCAWPDKGAGVKNKTYPYSLETESIFTIGAATRDGNPAPRVGDGQPTFFLPGIELGIPLKTEAKKTIVDNEPKLYQRTGEQPPGTYQTFSGSSLSCALAAGLAAMILHCSRKVQNKQAWRLNNYEYMKMAFESIDMSEHKWLAVGQRFGNSNIKTAKPSARRQVLNQVVDMFF
ncbi:subtilisin-like protein, partial [Cadophora sp. DSE1049]